MKVSDHVDRDKESKSDEKGYRRKMRLRRILFLTDYRGKEHLGIKRRYNSEKKKKGGVRGGNSKGSSQD